MAKRTFRGANALSPLRVAAFLLVCAVSACAPERPQQVPESSTLPPEPLTRKQLLDPLLASSESVIVVNKHARTLDLYLHGVLQRQYPIVLGGHPEGRKRFEGDMRTPEGLYRVKQKSRHDRWQYFIAIDYPNADDRDFYERERRAGAVPEIVNQPLGIGGGIGIHGSDRPLAQERGEDWTQGCVAMRNHDLANVYDNVRVGTPVLMLP